MRPPPRGGISAWSIWGYLPVALSLSFVWLQGIVFSQTPKRLQLTTGKEIFETACVACHGHDGKGMPQTTLGFEPPATFPDFTDCSATVREADADWSAIIHNGGPVRGFSPIMPSFREALSGDQIDKVIQHLRAFCKETAWPPGEMNLPRPLSTGKAFPEDEWVLTSSHNTRGNPGFTTEFIYEKRFGARNQIEVKAPFAFNRPSPGTWYGGTGDIALGLKRVLASSKRTGSILSAAGEASFPTGNKARGLGKGVTVLEGFAAFAQLLPKNSFVQAQGGVELPKSTREVPRAVFWRTAVGASFAKGEGFGRLWSPMVEFLADRELGAGNKTNWDIVPQLQVTLNKRQHIRANAGFRIPMNNTLGRSTAVVFYLLWDFFDGGLRDGWK
ncbi:MAG: c-type cytochrome [Gammaproteobacteria bacterium]